MARTNNHNDMPDVPETDFIGAVCEVWAAVNYAAYHLACVRVYSQTAALQTDVDELRQLEQALRNMAQVDVIICRAHLAAFFWHLDHVFEALRIAFARGQKEHADQKYFWSAEERLQEVEQENIRREISAYRNKGHEVPAIIGCLWEKRGGKFLHHFLPCILEHQQNEPIEMNLRLQQYFEFVVNVWLCLVPGNLKVKFPRSFKFPVTVPHSFIGELPPELKEVRQLEVSIEASA